MARHSKVNNFLCKIQKKPTYINASFLGNKCLGFYFDKYSIYTYTHKRT